MTERDNCTEKSLDAFSGISIGGKVYSMERHLQARKRALRLGNTTINIESIFTGKVTLDKALGNIVTQRIKTEQ